MPDPYPIIRVVSADIEAAEQMGTKPKFWFRRGRERWLFKEPRENTGEHWAEKVVAELGQDLVSKPELCIRTRTRSAIQ